MQLDAVEYTVKCCINDSNFYGFTLVESQSLGHLIDSYHEYWNVPFICPKSGYIISMMLSKLTM